MSLFICEKPSQAKDIAAVLGIKSRKDGYIETTDHKWWGCTKVSPACKNCYAQSWAKRVGESKLWGKRGKRRFFSEKHWDQPIKWNKEVSHSGIRKRVFCASMADLFEGRSDLQEYRDRVWGLIEKTPNLDWLLLTKRVHLVESMIPFNKNNWPENIWLGTTVEDQRRAQERLPDLISLGAKIKFLSCEPLLSEVNLGPWIDEISWVIAGGETGPKARPMNPTWLRALRDQVVNANKAFHFKQWGDWFPVTSGENDYRITQTLPQEDGKIIMAKIGKKKAGRTLDGKTWDQLPVSPTVL